MRMQEHSLGGNRGSKMDPIASAEVAGRDWTDWRDREAYKSSLQILRIPYSVSVVLG